MAPGLPSRMPPIAVTPTSGRARAAAAAAAIVVVLLLLGCGGEGSGGGERTPGGGDRGAPIRPDPANAGRRITLGSKGFTESAVVARIYGQALTAAGFDVRYDLNLGLEGKTTRAMQQGRIDAYPEYTGTALSVLLGVPIREVPKDPDEAWALSRRLYAEKLGFSVYERTPFEDSNSVGLLPRVARRIGNPRRISDLAPHDQDLTIAASRECFSRADCLVGLREVYGLEFEEGIVIDVAQRHTVVERGRAEVTIPFTTDGRIAQNRMIVLEDDRNLFPPYNVHLVVRQDAERRLGPGLQDVVERVDDQLTTPMMIELNSRVDLDGERPEDVARTYLRENGHLR